MKQHLQPLKIYSLFTTGSAMTAILLMVATASAEDFRFDGALGNSGGSEQARVTFHPQTAPGMGPVVDDDLTIWERGGAKQLNRYALDGRLLASFALPESTDRSDQLTRVGDLLVMKIRKDLYTLSVDAAEGATVQRVAANVDAMSSSHHDNRIVIFDKSSNQLFWFDPSSGERTKLTQVDFTVHAINVDTDGTVYAFGGSQVHAWKDGKSLVGFPKDFRGERPQKIGRYWYSHSWHGTIHRMNERFEPSPGVVLGGASGSFIGYLPQSVDVTNGRGLAHVRDNIYAVSGLGGVVQLLAWNEDEQRFAVARRLGALVDLTGVALDRDGRIWTPRGSWQWADSCEVPHSLGDKEPDVHAQPVVLQGSTLCLLKKHYSFVQLATGPVIDASGWSHLSTKGIAKFELPADISGAAVVSSGKGQSLIVARKSGGAFEIGITPEGIQRSAPAPITIAGLKNCTSLASLGNRLYAADHGAILAFEREGSNDWKLASTLATNDGEAYLHSDGKRIVASDTAGGKVDLLDANGKPLGSYRGLQRPTHVAVAGDRVVVYEAGRQRLIKLELVESSPKSSAPRWQAATKLPSPPSEKQTHGEVDFQDRSRPAGLPFAVALTPDEAGLTVSIRTAAQPVPQIQLGVANDKTAYVLTNQHARWHDGQFDFHLPGGEWSTVRLAAAVQTESQQERFGFTDQLAIHAPFSRNPIDWEMVDLENYRELVNARRQEIRITFDQPTAGKTTIVIEDSTGRRIRNLISARSYSAGKHTVTWDGLDETGRLVAPGNYRWRGITHPGIEPVYKMNFANGGETTVAPWGPNHSTLHAAATNGELVFFAAPVTEGGWGLMGLDADGKFVQGYELSHGYGIQHNAIAVDAKYLYCAQDGFIWGGTKDVDLQSDTWTATWKVTIVRYDIASGKLVDFPNRQRAIVVDEMQVGPGSQHPDLDEFNLGGLAAHDGKLFVGSRDEQAVLVLDAETGKQINRIALANVRHLTAGDDVYAGTDNGVFRLSDGERIVDATKMQIAGIAISPKQEILISDATSHQIHRYTAKGDFVGTIGTPGGPYKGRYQPERMVRPAGLVFGPDGKLWVTEDRWNPKRVLAWDLAKNQVVYEKFGMPHYGGDGSGFDPENPNRWIGLGCFWDVDIEQGTARPTHILSLEEGHFGNYAPHSYRFFRQDGRTFVCARGKIALISEVLPNGTLHDLAAIAGTHLFSYGCQWDPPQAYLDAFYGKWPQKRAEERRGRKGDGKPWSQRGMGVLWVDRNGDGDVQPEEFEFCGDNILLGGSAWGHLQTSLTFEIPVLVDEQVKIMSLAPRGFLANGVPDYPSLDEAISNATDIDLTPGYKRSGVATVRDRFGRFIFNSDPEMNAYQDGQAKWTYPNQWSNVHGSHKAPLPEPGVMQGTLGILGVAPLDDQSDVIFLNGNHGRCFLLSTDGLYLDEAFVDVRVGYLKNEYRLGGEIFGGSFDRSSVDDKYYVQIGHGPYRIYELKGLSDTHRIAGNIDVRKEQILAAQQQQLRSVAQSQTTKRTTIPGKVRWDKSGKFQVEVELSSDDEHLHLHYRVQDASPWVNHGRDWTKLFATGDSVDFQFGTDPRAPSQRRQPVVGDKRLLIAPSEGGPIAVLYEHRKPDGKNPIVFTSPWRGEKVDNVQRLSQAKIDVQVNRGGYEVKVTVPLAALGLDLNSGKTYRGDFGVTYGDAEGTETNLRSYWSNQSTGLVDDIPGEIMLSPSLWGEIDFQPGGDDSTR